MSGTKFAWFCERMVSGVVISNIEVKRPFVPFDRMFVIEKAQHHDLLLLLRAPPIIENS